MQESVEVSAHNMLLAASGSGINSIPLPELDIMESNLLADLIAPSSHLTEITQYYAKLPSNQLRAKTTFLFCRATNGVARGWKTKIKEAEASASKIDTSRPSHECVLPSQILAAESIELIHTAFLFHDVVLDNSHLRRGALSAPEKYGSQKSILAGDFIIGRIIELAARLDDREIGMLVVSAMLTTINGEMIQAQSVKETLICVEDTEREKGRLWQAYLERTYAKTASLFSLGLICSVILGGASKDDHLREIAVSFGTELGMALQILDDVPDYEDGDLGKPIDDAELNLGLATAPVLFAWEENREMGTLIQRKFSGNGDVEKVMTIVKTSGAILRTKALASLYAERAKNALQALPNTDAKKALESLAESLVLRKQYPGQFIFPYIVDMSILSQKLSHRGPYCNS